MDLSIKTDCGRVNVRVCALIRRGDKVLFEIGYNNKFFVLPGGRVTFGERAEDAIKRELKEELNVDADIKRCLFVHQNFFNWIPGERCHEIAFYFLAEIPDDCLLCDTISNLDGKSKFYWKTVEEAKQMRILPLFVKQCLDELPSQIQFVSEQDWDE